MILCRGTCLGPITAHRIYRLPQTLRYLVTVYATLSRVLAGELPYGMPMVWFLNPDAGPKALIGVP